MSATTPPGIILNEVGFEYQGESRAILRDVTLFLEFGQFVGIVGPNGSGKTTLAKLLNASLTPTSGTVFVDDLPTSNPHNELAVKRLVSFVSSDPSTQFVTSTVLDEVAFALQAAWLETEEIIKRTAFVLDLFELTQYRDIHPFHLSIGEQFRLLLATAWARSPHYLILDEVTSMMDSHMRHSFLKLLKEQRGSSEITPILITHRLDDLFEADRIIVIDEGQIVADGSVGHILSQVMQHPHWKIEVPLVYQLAELLPPRFHSSLPEVHGRVLKQARNANNEWPH